jgi:uncharacterized protein YndB with AHSA1/START domain
MTELEPIRRAVTVRLDPERAFELFTAEMDAWWPVETHARSVDEFEEETVKTERLEFQGRVGGRILEHLSTGEARPWGEITEWDPPSRFVVAWKPNSRPTPPTELEVRFVPDGSGTRVELEHRGWERLGEIAAEAHAGYSTGWNPVLERFETAAGKEVV